MSRSNRSNAFDSSRDVSEISVDSDDDSQQQPAPASSSMVETLLQGVAYAGGLATAAGVGLFGYGLYQKRQAANLAKAAQESGEKAEQAWQALELANAAQADVVAKANAAQADVVAKKPRTLAEKKAIAAERIKEGTSRVPTRTETSPSAESQTLAEKKATAAERIRTGTTGWRRR